LADGGDAGLGEAALGAAAGAGLAAGGGAALALPNFSTFADLSLDFRWMGFFGGVLTGACPDFLPDFLPVIPEPRESQSLTLAQL
jgi:hypothetical protein